jgi:hypothetical protein
VADYESHFVEQQVEHSNALHSLLRGSGSYLVGPLARFNLNYSRLPDVAQQVARECGLAVPCRNPFRSIVVRAVEMVFACWEALRVLREYRQPASSRAEVPDRAGEGCAATEAPRGTLYQDGVPRTLTSGRLHATDETLAAKVGGKENGPGSRPGRGDGQRCAVDPENVGQSAFWRVLNSVCIWHNVN